MELQPGSLVEVVRGSHVTLWSVALGVATLAVGIVAVRIALGLLRSTLRRLGASELVVDVVAKVAAVFLYTAVVIAAAGVAGLNVSALVLGLTAAAGLILAFGLQEVMQNMAAGVWLAIARPFDRGDVVEVAGRLARVEEIGILSTRFSTLDGLLLLVPNRLVWGQPIVNYTRTDARRIEVDVGVSYSTDLGSAIEAALEAANSVKAALPEPKPEVVVKEFGDSSIVLGVRVWCRPQDYWACRSELIRAIHATFTERGIEIPFPQLDVHVRDHACCEATTPSRERGESRS